MASSDRYEFVRELGSGGMGSVYLAKDRKLHRMVAVKVIRLENDDPSHREQLSRRFETEARVAASLTHTNVVTVYDFAEEDGQAHLMMEFVDGVSLAERARQQPELGEKLQILRDAAAGLDYAHSHGIVHRDVKPGNLLIRKDGVTKLSDFGIAKIGEVTGLTMTGQAIGTPHYMSPEMLEARPGQGLDGRSDQFSLGVVAYELLAGQRPFQADSIGQLVLTIMRAEPPEFHMGSGDHSPELNQVFRRVLAKDPAQRFNSCGAFVAELARVCGVASSLSHAASRTSPQTSPHVMAGPAPVSATPLSFDASQMVGVEAQTGIETNTLAQAVAYTSSGETGTISRAEDIAGTSGPASQPSYQVVWWTGGAAAAVVALIAVVLWLRGGNQEAPVVADLVVVAEDSGEVAGAAGQAVIVPPAAIVPVAPSPKQAGNTAKQGGATPGASQISPTPAVLTDAGKQSSAVPQPTPIASATQALQLIRQVQPQYPELARQAGVQGTVLFRATIDPQGKVSEVEYLQGNPLLVDAARDAVRQWEYRPNLVNGAAVAVTTQIEVNFQLTQAPVSLLPTGKAAAPNTAKAQSSEPAGQNAAAVAPNRIYEVGENGVSSPQILTSPTPVMTAEARAANLREGKVMVETVVGLDGRPQNPVSLQSPGYGLEQNAIAAVREWTFRPGMLNGVAVPVRVRIEVVFRLR